MLQALRILTALADRALVLPGRVVRTVMTAIPFNPRLGPLRHVATAAIVYVVFAITLVYVIAPIRAYTGSYTLADKIGYDAERWLATAIYDPDGNFAGTFDARLDSLRDVNYSDEAIEVGDYVANPDHKSIPVRDVPEQYWQCLSYHEDRNLGTIWNPWGIDLIGVLKIPLTTIRQSIASRRLRLGVGGSTLPMQFARVIYKTPPSRDEGVFGKLQRKVGEWWLAPVIYRELTRGGDETLLRQWAANHIWLAQRTGGQSLHGVEVTSRVVFGKEAKDLSTAEQFVLASAVNKPIIVLKGSDRLNEVRLDRWRYITEVRARTCAEKLITDPAEQARVVFELVSLAGGPPDPKVRPKLQQALERFAPDNAKRAEANPAIRANVLLPSTRFAIREEMKQHYGFAWRDYVRGVTTTFDVYENLAFRETMLKDLSTLDQKWKSRMMPGFTLDPAMVNADKALPQIAIVAADTSGRIVRYFETGELAPYFGSWPARDPGTGLYDPKREGRMIASTGKMLAAIALGNQTRDTPDTIYPDANANAPQQETCAHGGPRNTPGGKVGGRRASVVFACSLNEPLMQRAARAGQSEMQRLIDGFGFAMPPAAIGGATPATTAAILGQIGAAPRRVHHMSAVILGALIGQGRRPIPAPSLIRSYDYTFKGDDGAGRLQENAAALVPENLIRPRARAFVSRVLSAPLCHQVGGKPAGTLRELSRWCAGRRGDVRLHFAKTGTQSGRTPSETVDTWISGGVQFANGAAYSYVAVIGTGNANTPWAENLHAGQVVSPLVDALLDDLAAHAKAHPRRDLLPARKAPPTKPTSMPTARAPSASQQGTPIASTVPVSSATTRAAAAKRALTPNELLRKSLAPF